MKNFLRKNKTLIFLLNITPVYEKTRFDSQITQFTTQQVLQSELNFSPSNSVTGVRRTGRVKIGFEIEPSVFGEDDLFLEFHCCFARFIQFFNGKLKKRYDWRRHAIKRDL